MVKLNASDFSLPQCNSLSDVLNCFWRSVGNSPVRRLFDWLYRQRDCRTPCAHQSLSDAVKVGGCLPMHLPPPPPDLPVGLLRRVVKKGR
eukprot:10677302-Karenia_brevis.AAC.1